MIHEVFHAAALAHPDKTALIVHNGRLTYAQLAEKARARASELQELGVAKGDRVALIADNSEHSAIAVWAILEAGAALIPLHAATRPDALKVVLEHADAHWLLRPNGAAPESLPASLPGDPALAAILYTSGSTGEPKGVMLSHENMTAALRAVNAYLQLQATDVLYSALPLSSSYGLYQLIMGLSLGASVILDRSFSFPAKSLALLAQERATVLAGVPTMFAWLSNTPILEKYDLSTLRILTSAAAALPIEHARRVRERLPHARLFVMYGQTECKRISYLEPEAFDLKAGSVGRGIPYQEHAVIDEAGHRVQPGEIGELAVSGPHVMRGYWRDPQGTARKLRPIADSERTWLHTDDLFKIDADGYLYFMGRRDDILKIGGNKVSPREIEELLCQIPAVSEAAVIGMPDDVWGQAAKAYVALKDGAACTEQEVIQYCTPRLRGFMVPKHVVFVRSLPKTESGKIKKRDLA
ncbi:MAG: class I adenylate-forming enzyme family protein [Steroidobacteraceae bacterium]